VELRKVNASLRPLSTASNRPAIEVSLGNSSNARISLHQRFGQYLLNCFIWQEHPDTRLTLVVWSLRRRRSAGQLRAGRSRAVVDFRVRRGVRAQLDLRISAGRVAIRDYRNCLDDCGAAEMVESDSAGWRMMKDISKLFIDIPKGVTWVALDHDQHRVVAYGATWDEVIQKAKDAGENFPSMCKMRAPDDDTSLP
jgi:hypothetical protein